ncbi:MAG: endoribonuclease MazF [Deltaproteobacteria bacterium]|nr:endoribonuclease MazF [Deltaproteobacteria bacterium]
MSASTKRRYVPEKGDIIWLNFTPNTGREQGGRRPALVISPRGYNHKVGLAVCCPITSRIKGYPFEVILSKGLSVSGAILADHLKNLDWRVRRAEFETRVPKAVMQEVLAKISALLLEV